MCIDFVHHPKVVTLSCVYEKLTKRAIGSPLELI